MRGVFRPEPKFLAVFTSLNLRRLSVGTKIPGSFFQFKRQVLFGQDRNSCRRLPVLARGVFRPEPKFLAVLTNLSAMRFSVRTQIPGDVFHFECEVFVGQNQSPWQ